MLVTAICALALFASSCDFAEEGDARKTLSEAFEALSGKNADWKKAKPLAEKAARQDPNDHRAKILLAAAYEQGGQISQAVDELKKAVKIAPDDFTAQYTLGRIYFESGKFDDCLGPLVSACRIDPDSGTAAFYLARTYQKLRQNKNAHGKFYKLAKMPEFKKRPEPFNELGMIYLQEKDLKNANLAFIAAYRRAQENHKVVWNLAVFYDAYARNPASAVGFYEKYQQMTLANPELAAKREIARKRVQTLKTASGRR
jgi:Flp pilus assembly protein TadD